MTPEQFIHNLHVPTAAGNRRFGDVMADFQRERFAGIFPALVAVANAEAPPVSRHWWEATKGASKDSDVACCLLWLLAFSPRQLRIQIGAYDADQADEIRQIAKQLLRIDAPLNKALAGVIDVRADEIVSLRTESRAEILTTDSKGTHGSRPDVVVLNELSHVADREFAETLLDNADKMPRGLVVIATNAGFDPSWQLEWKRAAVASSRWLVHEHKLPAPWISAADLAESEKRNSRSRYRRLWWGEWASEDGDQLDRGQIERAITLPGPTYAPRAGYSYFLGADLALRRDAAAVVLVGRDVGQWIDAPATEQPVKSTLQLALEDIGSSMFDDDGEPFYRPPAEAAESGTWQPGTGAIELAQVLTFKPTKGQEIDLGEIERTVGELSRAFRASALFDEWQAAFLAQRLRAMGVEAATVAPTAPVLRETAQLILDGFSEGTFKLWRAAALIADIQRWRLVEKTYGMRLVSPTGIEGESTRHGDAASAYALAVLCARRFAGAAPVIANYGQPLICWP